MSELRKARKSLKMSAKALASMVGITPMSIYRYERGERIPDVRTAEKIADVFGCRIEELFASKSNRKDV